jgi:hypothetical protein
VTGLRSKATWMRASGSCPGERGKDGRGGDDRAAGCFMRYDESIFGECISRGRLPGPERVYWRHCCPVTFLFTAGEAVKRQTFLFQLASASSAGILL